MLINAKPAFNLMKLKIKKIFLNNIHKKENSLFIEIYGAKR